MIHACLFFIHLPREVSAVHTVVQVIHTCAYGKQLCMFHRAAECGGTCGWEDNQGLQIVSMAVPGLELFWRGVGCKRTAQKHYICASECKKGEHLFMYLISILAHLNK